MTVKSDWVMPAHTLLCLLPPSDWGLDTPCINTSEFFCTCNRSADRFQVYTEDLHVILKLFFSVCQNPLLSQAYLNDSVHKTQATLTGTWASNSQRLICSAFGGLGCKLLNATVLFFYEFEHGQQIKWWTFHTNQFCRHTVICPAY